MDKEWWDGLTQSWMRIERDTSVDDQHSLTIDLYFGIILMHLHYIKYSYHLIKMM